MDKKRYAERLVEEQKRTGLTDAAMTGCGMIRARRVAFGVTDSAFIMGSMGSVVGERLTRLIERATEQQLPLIIISGSGGGAGMHEGILSLMQMAKVSAALARYDRAGGLFISVLTNPTMGGVAASFAALGRRGLCRTAGADRLCRPADDQGHDPHRTARGLSDQRVPAGARLHRPHRAPRQAEERNRPHDRLLREVSLAREPDMGLWDKLQSLLRSDKLDITMRFELLGEGFLGTMSKFHKARDRKTNRIVGLKICDPDKTEFFETRFRGLGKPSEGEIAMSLKHPRIVETYEFGADDQGADYILMEFLTGSGLHTLIRHRDSGLEGKRVDADPADGRSHAGGARRRLHPPRCLPAEFHLLRGLRVAEVDRFRLDACRTSRSFGSPATAPARPMFMAPEIVRRRPTDRRVDIFAFGVSAYQLLTFEHPWPNNDYTTGKGRWHDTEATRCPILKCGPA